MLCTAWSATACSDDPEPVGGPSSNSSTTSTLPPDAFGPPSGGSSGAPPEPPGIAWVAQFGGAGDEVVNGVAGRELAVLAVGSTTGVVGPDPAAHGGGLDVLSAAIAAEDGSVRGVHQRGGPGDDVARSIDSATAAATVLACGDTTADLGVAHVGLTDGWCAPVDPEGVLGAPAQSGSDELDSFRAVAVAADGSHGVAAGTTVGLFPGAQDPTGGMLGGGDAVVSRVDGDGRPIWVRQFGTLGTDTSTGAAPVAEGDTVVSGFTDGALEAVQFGGDDGWVARFDPFGNLRWVTQFGSGGTDRAEAVAAGGDAARGTELFCAVGSTTGTLAGSGFGSTDAFVAAFDATGDRTWTSQLGSDGVDRATAVAVDGGLVYVAGTAGGLIDGATRAELQVESELGGTDGFLAGVDAATGNVLWVVQFGTAADEEVTSITVSEQGLVVVGGSTAGQMSEAPPAGGTDAFVVAFTPPSGAGGAASAV